MLRAIVGCVPSGACSSSSGGGRSARGRDVRWFVEKKTCGKTTRKAKANIKTHLITTLTLILNPPLLRLPSNNRNRIRNALSTFPSTPRISVFTLFTLLHRAGRTTRAGRIHPRDRSRTTGCRSRDNGDISSSIGRFGRQSSISSMRMRVGMSVCVPISNRVCVAERM